MAGLLSLATSEDARTLGPNEVLIEQGAPGGDLFMLESGELTVERDGVAVATITRPHSLVGEMSVLLGSNNSATVRADGYATVRVIRGARERLMADPQLSFEVASLLAGRLSATTALLVDLTREHSGKVEQGLLKRIFSAILLPADGEVVSRRDLFDPA